MADWCRRRVPILWGRDMEEMTCQMAPTVGLMRSPHEPIHENVERPWAAAVARGRHSDARKQTWPGRARWMGSTLSVSWLIRRPIRGRREHV